MASADTGVEGDVAARRDSTGSAEVGHRGAEDITSRLGAIQDLARRREARIRLICFGVGTLILVCGAPMGVLCFLQLIPGFAGSLGPGPYFSYSILGAQMLMLALKPTDRKWMPRVIMLLCWWLSFIGILLIAVAIDFKRSDCALHGFDGSSCNVWAICTGLCAVPSCFIVPLYAYIVRWNSSGYILDAHQMLELFWWGLRLYGASIGIILLSHTIAIAALDT